MSNLLLIEVTFICQIISLSNSLFLHHKVKPLEHHCFDGHFLLLKLGIDKKLPITRQFLFKFFTFLMKLIESLP